MPSTTLEKRTVPETVTIPGELALNILGHLEGIADVFAVMNGWDDWKCDGSHDARLLELMSQLDEAAFGPIPGDHEGSDEPWHTDPITVEREARGNEVAAEMLETMLADEGEHLGLRRMVAFAFEPIEERKRLRNFVHKQRENARAMREAGSIDVMYPEGLRA